MSKNKRAKWFRAVRGSYLPATWQGIALYLVFVVFLMASLITAFRTQETAQDGVYFVFPQWICATVVITWIANRKS